MNKALYIAVAVVVVLTAVLLVMGDTAVQAPAPVACTMEAKQCPDGSFVGREGPECTFAACPEAGVGIGKSITIEGVTLTPQTILEDSRCPEDVQCIWAGDFRAEVLVVDGERTTTSTMGVGSFVRTSAGTIVLSSVLPIPNSRKTIKEKDYEFFFAKEDLGF